MSASSICEDVGLRVADMYYILICNWQLVKLLQKPNLVTDQSSTRLSSCNVCSFQITAVHIFHADILGFMHVVNPGFTTCEYARTQSRTQTNRHTWAHKKRRGYLWSSGADEEACTGSLRLASKVRNARVIVWREAHTVARSGLE